MRWKRPGSLIWAEEVELSPFKETTRTLETADNKYTNVWYVRVDIKGDRSSLQESLECGSREESLGERESRAQILDWAGGEGNKEKVSDSSLH